MRIILADPHQHALRALIMTLQEEPGLEIVGEAVDSTGLLMLAEKVDFDLVLIDGMLPDLPIEELITLLHVKEHRPIVIMMSNSYEDSRMMLRAGADAFISKGDQPDWLLEKLRKYSRQVK